MMNKNELTKKEHETKVSEAEAAKEKFPDKQCKCDLLEKRLKNMELTDQTETTSSPPLSGTSMEEGSLVTVVEPRGLEVVTKREHFHVQLARPRLNTQLNHYDMSKLAHVLVADAQFARWNCRFCPVSAEGRYRFTVEVQQRGAGGMGLWLRRWRWRRDEVKQGSEKIGWTYGEGQVARREIEWTLMDGEEVWVWVDIYDGNPRVSRCEFSGFRVG